MAAVQRFGSFECCRVDSCAVWLIWAYGFIDALGIAVVELRFASSDIYRRVSSLGALVAEKDRGMGIGMGSREGRCRAGKG